MKSSPRARRRPQRRWRLGRASPAAAIFAPSSRDRGHPALGPRPAARRGHTSPKDLTAPSRPRPRALAWARRAKTIASSKKKTSEERLRRRHRSAYVDTVPPTGSARNDGRLDRGPRGAAPPHAVVGGGVGRSTRATAKKVASRENASVAFGGGSSRKRRRSGKRPGPAAVPSGAPGVASLLAQLASRILGQEVYAKTAEALELESSAAPRTRPQGEAAEAPAPEAAEPPRAAAAAAAAASEGADTRDPRARSRRPIASMPAARSRAKCDSCAPPSAPRWPRAGEARRVCGGGRGTVAGSRAPCPPRRRRAASAATARRAALRAPPGASLEKDPARRRRGARMDAWRRHVDEPLPRSRHERRVRAFGRVDGATCPAPFAPATDRRGEAARAELEFRLEQKARLEAQRARARRTRPTPKTSSSRRRSRLDAPTPDFGAPPPRVSRSGCAAALSAYEQVHQRHSVPGGAKLIVRRCDRRRSPGLGGDRASFVGKKSDAPRRRPPRTCRAGARRARERAARDAELADPRAVVRRRRGGGEAAVEPGGGD